MKKIFKMLLIILVLPLVLYEGYYQILQYKNRPKQNAENQIQTRSTDIRYVDRGHYWNYPLLEKFIAYNEDGEKIDIESDELGFRNEIKDLNQEINQHYDVLLLGDSFTSAANTKAERTYAHQIKKSGLSLYNAGIDGTGTIHQAHILQDVLNKIKPKVVILNFYLGNDFRDNFYCPEISSELSTKPIANESKSPTPKNLSSWIQLKTNVNNLMQYSGVLKLFYNAIYLPAKYEGTDMSYYDRGEMMIMAHLSQNPNPDTQKAIEKTDQALSYIKKILEQQNIKVIVVGIPSKAQVMKSVREISNYEQDKKAVEFFNKVKNDLDFDRPDKILADLCMKNGLPYFSLLKSFRKEQGKKLYYHFDVHWTYIGQEVAAKEVIPQVRKMLSMNQDAKQAR